MTRKIKEHVSKGGEKGIFDLFFFQFSGRSARNISLSLSLIPFHFVPYNAYYHPPPSFRHLIIELFLRQKSISKHFVAFQKYFLFFFFFFPFQKKNKFSSPHNFLSNS